jgi:hypothetical protein
VQIDSRLHDSDVAIHSSLGGQQWRRRERRKQRLKRRRRRQRAGRRSSQRRSRSSTSHESKIASHGPAAIEGGSMIPRDAPAQVDDRGRRRDGDSGFTIARTERGGGEEGRDIRTSPRQHRRRIRASGLSPTPSVCRRFCRKILNGAAVLNRSAVSLCGDGG